MDIQTPLGRKKCVEYFEVLHNPLCLRPIEITTSHTQSLLVFTDENETLSIHKYEKAINMRPEIRT